MTSYVWAPDAGRELDTTPLPATPRTGRVVACLNVWNDLEALQQTMPSWAHSVDAIVAIYGPYAGTAPEPSDGTLEYLRQFPHVTIRETTDLTQCQKRSVYFAHLNEGDYAFIIDADESVTHADALREDFDCDVGWVRMRSPLYTRSYGQPRIIRWQPELHYRGRHHWIYAEDRLLCTHQYGGPGFSHRPIALEIHNQRGLGRRGDRLLAKRHHQAGQVTSERPMIARPLFSQMSDEQIGGREALQIVHSVYRDDGIAPSRLHTAINRTTPHASLFFKQRPGPYDVPTQFSSITHVAQMRRAIESADVVHFHVVMSLAKQVRRTMHCVFHHHGSLLRANHKSYMAEGIARNALILVSNLELLTYTEGLGHFLPNTIPVARYAALRALQSPPFSGTRPFRVAHSPSQPHRKGTEHFLAACQSLQSRGVPIEPVVIHDLPHRQALALKATCDAAFDSFWLGMQCSGIEAAAMGIPVIAGDDTVAERSAQLYGAVPYTFANDREHLEYELEQLITDQAYWRQERDRVFHHVVQYHDESAVTLRYLDLLDLHFGWRAGSFHRPRRIPLQRRVR